MEEKKLEGDFEGSFERKEGTDSFRFVLRLQDPVSTTPSLTLSARARRKKMLVEGVVPVDSRSKQFDFVWVSYHSVRSEVEVGEGCKNNLCLFPGETMLDEP